MKPYRTNRNQAYIRHYRQRIIKRKKRKLAQWGWAYKHDGSFAKGKIHCSCWWCCKKTKRLGYPKSELVRITNCQEQLMEV
ncbi:hypothetical protein H1230_06700 [Paenibacillus sp. 19GGS1-52]|uniref:hypothetical protein n=1 Tax=Paenibacillus sp. 19GGS1-52 TaxID=2758563 RepID=UPI001EFA3F7F|nr:hypothetical protein [Paenibacillus sp. 19GGS1-52]ULO08491.1 hypothetical protein H1230_06700 [Paenibacillus sp. 19GGS1-52]